MLDEARNTDVEICGLMLGARPAFVVAAVSLRNRADDPGCAFVLDPAGHLAAQRQAREQGLKVVGCYHSHPNGNAGPSAADAAGTHGQSDGFLWAIIASGGLNVWRVAPQGPVHGRFAPVDWTVSSE